MKKYYNTLNKNEKNKIKEMYKKEYKNSNLNNSLIRLKIYAIIGFITSIVLYIDAFLNDIKVYNVIIATILLIASLIFLIGSIVLKRKKLNKLALKNK